MCIQSKHRRRNLERKWKRSRLTVDHQIYRDQCIVVNKLLRKTRVDYYSEQIMACGRDQKGLFRVAKHLLGEKKPPSLPQCSTHSDLPEAFSTYFSEKICAIRRGIQSDNADAPDDVPTDSAVTTTLSTIAPATQDELRKLIMSAPAKSCDLDPLPTWQGPRRSSVRRT